MPHRSNMDGGAVTKLLDSLKRKAAPLALTGYLAFLAVLFLGVAHNSYFSVKTPDQPVEFNHRVHVETRGLECDYCHIYAERSKSAGIPAMSTCMECHENAARDNPEAMKLVGYWEDGQPVPWVRVHSLPDHAHFTHKRHVKAGVDCTVCHGQMTAMTVARKVKSLEMGWCVSCHRENGAPADCMICHY